MDFPRLLLFSFAQAKFLFSSVTLLSVCRFAHAWPRYGRFSFSRRVATVAERASSSAIPPCEHRRDDVTAMRSGGRRRNSSTVWQRGQGNSYNLQVAPGRPRNRRLTTTRRPRKPRSSAPHESDHGAQSGTERQLFAGRHWSQRAKSEYRVGPYVLGPHPCRARVVRLVHV